MSKGFKWFLIGLGIAILLAGGFMVGVYYSKKATPTTTTTTTTAIAKRTTTTTTTAVSEYAGWKTYTNNDIGYQLKYPADWTVLETDQYSEVVGTTVKYITIKTADEKYFLYFGLKKEGGAYEISDRTGMGAGEMIDESGSITILDIKVTPEDLVWQAKAKEVFYNQPSGSSTNYQFQASFSYSQGADFDNLDMSTLSEKKTVEKILKSVKIL